MEFLKLPLAPNSAEFQQVHQWLQKLVVEKDLEDAATCRQMVSLFLKLSRQTKTLPQILRNVCQDIHSQLGDIDQDTTGGWGSSDLSIRKMLTAIII